MTVYWCGAGHKFATESHKEAKAHSVKYGCRMTDGRGKILIHGKVERTMEFEDLVGAKIIQVCFGSPMLLEVEKDGEKYKVWISTVLDKPYLLNASIGRLVE
jgi:formylmethanofuran dehydrogenase subunit C